MNRRFHLSIFNPAILIALLFFLQYLIWNQYSLDIPRLHGVSPRFEDYRSLFYHISLALTIVFTTAVGKVFSDIVFKNRSGKKNDIDIDNIKLLGKIAIFASVFGEIVYIRPFISNPQIIIDSISGGNLVNIAVSVREQSITGISSLNNLFLVSAICFTIVAIYSKSSEERSTHWKYLILLSMAVVLHSFMLSARMFLIYFLVAFIFTLVYYAPHILARNARKMVIAIIFLLFFIYFNEFARNAVSFSMRSGNDIYSFETYNYILQRLLEAYFISDLNNAMIVLNCTPSQQWISTTMFAGFANLNEYYWQCEYWYSLFGTMNITALAYFDMGLYAFLYLGFIGLAIGASYSIVIKSTPSLNSVTAIMIISGSIHILRINYYALSIFVLPIALILLFQFYQLVFKRR